MALQSTVWQYDWIWKFSNYIIMCCTVGQAVTSMESALEVAKVYRLLCALY